MYEFAAELTILIHFTFIAFVVFGGLFFFVSRKFIYIHVPVLIWGVFIELTQIVCPLTYLENWFLQKANLTAHSGSFISNHLVPIIYPANLTENTQIYLVVSLLLVNTIIYGLIISKIKICYLEFF